MKIRQIIDRFHQPDFPNGRFSETEATNKLTFNGSDIYKRGINDLAKVVCTVNFDISSVLHVDLCLTQSLNFAQISNGHLVTKTKAWPQSVPLC